MGTRFHRAAVAATLAAALAAQPGRCLAAEVAEAGIPEAAVPRAAPAASSDLPREVRTVPAERSGSALATAAAVFPGLLLPGVGHFVLGDREGGKHFLVLDAVGLAMVAMGFGGDAAVGGADRLSALTLTPAVAGTALLVVGWLADIVGSANGDRPWLPPTDPPGSLSLSLGYSGLYGSKVDFHNGIDLGARWRYGRLTVEPWGTLDPEMSFYGTGLRLAVIVMQDPSDPVTRLSAVLEGVHRRYRLDRYSTTVAEAHGEMRLNLGHLTKTLKNTWMLVRLGSGVEAFAYDSVHRDLADFLPLLVLEVGAGARLGQRVSFEFLYRSRKDDLPGGIIIPGLFDSYLGMFELDGRVTLTDRFALRAGLRYGTGLLPWIALESVLF